MEVTTYLDFDFFISGLDLVRRDADDARRARDLLDGAHEDVGDDGDAEEAPEQPDEVEEGATSDRPRILADERQEKSLVGAGVVIEVDIAPVVHRPCRRPSGEPTLSVTKGTNNLQLWKLLELS